MEIPGWLLATLEILTGIFIFLVGVAALALVVLFFVDRYQTKNTVLRNYPVIGHFRYLFEHLGEFFRQYFFALDREELPFNRAQRSWVYRAAKNEGNTLPFGSTKDLRPVGTVIFANCAFPPLEEEKRKPSPVCFGPDCAHPYLAPSFFNISAMSFGSLSKPAIQALSMGAKKAGVWLNTGEGGLAPWHLEGGCDVVFQLGTAKYGARAADGGLDEQKLRAIAGHEQVRMIELKLAQGAKPGKGGILPAGKVTPEIAAIRGIPENQDSISPNRHPEVSNDGELLDLVGRIRDITGKPTGFKTVLSESGSLDDLFGLIRERGLASAPDFITLDGGDGGTGAAPQPLMDEMGLPLRESLPMLIDKLVEYGLRERIRVIAAGKRVNPSEVAWALCMGADTVNTARGFMFALGCIQALRCHKNTCPTGVTTHDPDLQRGLVPAQKAERVAHFAQNMVKEVEIIAHSCGVAEPRDLERRHARIVGADGLSVPLHELHPPAETRPAFRHAPALAPDPSGQTANH